MSLGGKNTSSTTIDPDLKRAALENLAIAKQVGQLGFVPYTGATVAGMQPGQIAAMKSTNMAADAFGMPSAPIPTEGDYSPYADYQRAIQNMSPGQRAFIEAMFINPITGAAPTGLPGAVAQQPGGGVVIGPDGRPVRVGGQRSENIGAVMRTGYTPMAGKTGGTAVAKTGGSAAGQSYQKGPGGSFLTRAVTSKYAPITRAITGNTPTKNYNSTGSAKK